MKNILITAVLALVITMLGGMPAHASNESTTTAKIETVELDSFRQADGDLVHRVRVTNHGWNRSIEVNYRWTHKGTTHGTGEGAYLRTGESQTFRVVIPNSAGDYPHVTYAVLNAKNGNVFASGDFDDNIIYSSRRAARRA